MIRFGVKMDFMKKWLIKLIFPFSMVIGHSIKKALSYEYNNVERTRQRKHTEKKLRYLEKLNLPQHPEKVKSFKNRKILLNYALSQVILDGIYCEFGVFQGESLNYLAKKISPELIYGFDSFDGLPEDVKGTNYKKGTFKTKIPDVRFNVRLIIGKFEDVLAEVSGHVWNNSKIVFAHIDCDLYSSAKCIFTKLKEYFSIGTVLVFDEFMNFPNFEEHEYKAFREFIEENQFRYEILGQAHEYTEVIIRLL